MNMEYKPRIIWVCKSLLISYIVTGMMLIIMALLLFKFEVSDQVTSIGIIITYVVSTLVGGFLIGKYMKVKKFLWGFIIGVLYIVLLFAITFAVYHTLDNPNIVTTIVLCIGGGTLGGMVS